MPARYCSFCIIAASIVPELRPFRSNGIESAAHRFVPRLVWHPLGDDAILAGYNEAAARFTPGIRELLGRASSEISGGTFYEDIMTCARDHQSFLSESVRYILGKREAWRILRFLHWNDEDEAVIVWFVPLERIGAAEKTAKKETKV